MTALNGTCASLLAENTQLKSQVTDLLAWARAQGFSG
jgi:hypothetical protein